MQRSVQEGGEYTDFDCWICLGCPLSPAISALYLQELDAAMLKNPHVFYARFMDDWVLLAKTRWHLRKAIQKMNEILAHLKLTKHPDKTEIGRLKKGFDFLGYRFSPKGLQIARYSLECFSAKVSRLYEQGADAVRIGHWDLYPALDPLGSLRRLCLNQSAVSRPRRGMHAYYTPCGSRRGMTGRRSMLA